MSQTMDLEARPRIYKSCLIRVGGYQDEHEEEVDEDRGKEEMEEEEGEEEEEDEEGQDLEEEVNEDEYMHEVDEPKETVGSLNPSFWELPLEEGEAEETVKTKVSGKQKAGGGRTVKAKCKKKEKEPEEKKVAMHASQFINTTLRNGTGANSSIVKKKTVTTYGKRKNNNVSVKSYGRRSPRYMQKQIDSVANSVAQPFQEEEGDGDMTAAAPEEFKTPEQQQQQQPSQQPVMKYYPIPTQERKIREELAEVQVARSSPNIDFPVDEFSAPTPKPKHYQQEVACMLSSGAVIEGEENVALDRSSSVEATKVEDHDNDNDNDNGEGPAHAQDKTHKRSYAAPEKNRKTLVFNDPSGKDTADPIKTVLSRIIHETEVRVAAMERDLDAELEAVQRDVQLHYEKLKADARIEIAREINKGFFNHGLRQQNWSPTVSGARMRDWPMRDEYYGIIPHCGREREGK